MLTGEDRARAIERAVSQAEILAAAFALHSLPDGSDVVVVSDSEYVVRGYNEWMPDWREHGWRRTDSKPVANVRHWQRLIAAVERHRSVEFRWTRGHDGTPGNEEADRLAGEARRLAVRRRDVPADRLVS